MKLEEIINQKKTKDVIRELKSGRQTALPDIEAAKRSINPELHAINDPLIRKDKLVKVDTDDANAQQIITVDNGTGTFRIEKVARIKLALQKLIIKRSVAFLFGNNVMYGTETANLQQELVMGAFKRILRDNKCNAIDREIARTIFGYKECAELWYPVPLQRQSNRYGFPCSFKLRCAIFSPEKGDTLYPYFDETGDMTAFSRAYSRKNKEDRQIDYFDTYTDSSHYLFIRQQSEGEYVIAEGYPKKNPIRKIPIVYGHQDYFETQDVDSLIDRLELLLSNFADTNDYHASPKIFVKGELKGFSKKGEAGAIIEGEDGSEAYYLAWANAPESVKLEIETLLKMINMLTQNPDISFDTVKGLGQLSGTALKLLFMDAHLKVQDKREIFDDYLQRRANVIKAYIGQFNTQLEAVCDEMDIEPEITPYMLTNEMDELNYWLTANGNKPIVSQEESIEKSGISNNPKETYEKLKDEESRQNSFLIGEPVMDA